MIPASRQAKLTMQLIITLTKAYTLVGYITSNHAHRTISCIERKKTEENTGSRNDGEEGRGKRLSPSVSMGLPFPHTLSELIFLVNKMYGQAPMEADKDAWTEIK
jgi:hypothetical protein